MSASLAAKGAKRSSQLFDKLLRRNLIGDIYPKSQEYHDKLNNILKKPTCVYAGFDATSNSLHVGNLATIMNLIYFQRHGHRVICVIGDATTQIGDPSGHSRDRLKMDKDVISKNASSIEETLQRLFRNHEKYFSANIRDRLQAPVFLRNSMWYNGKNVIDFVGEVFREVRVGGLLHKKSIAERLKSNEGMNMSEFSYQIFQAYDWLELDKLYGCRLQIGGSDQAGNIYTGHDMIKKLTGSTDSIGLLAPLILNSETGKKLGKSTENKHNNIWLRPEMTSPYQLYQFFQRTPDKDVEKYLKVFSLHEDDVIEDLIYNHLKKPEDVWYCQRKLAEHVCQLVHGDQGLESAKRITHAFYNRNPLDIAKLSDDELCQLFDKESIINMMHKDGLSVLDMTRKANCFNNDLDAERLISAGGLWLNGSRVASYNVPITEDLIIGNGITIMRVGKRNYFLFKWSNR